VDLSFSGIRLKPQKNDSNLINNLMSTRRITLSDLKHQLKLSDQNFLAYFGKIRCSKPAKERKIVSFFNPK